MTEKAIRRVETIVNPQEYIDIMASHATIRQLVKEISVFDWKTAIRDVLKTTQTLHFQVSKTKRIILEKTSRRKIMVRGEISYRNDICNSQTITKRGKKISHIVPTRIEEKPSVKTAKLEDVARLLQKHYGDSWRDIPNLTYYKDVLSNPQENLPSPDDDDDLENVIDEEVLDFI